MNKSRLPCFSTDQTKYPLGPAKKRHNLKVSGDFEYLMIKWSNNYHDRDFTPTSILWRKLSSLTLMKTVHYSFPQRFSSTQIDTCYLELYRSWEKFLTKTHSLTKTSKLCHGLLRYGPICYRKHPFTLTSINQSESSKTWKCNPWRQIRGFRR